MLQEWEQRQKETKQRRHQDIGQAQELFFFEEKYSPGSAFWMPQGARLYNKLCEWMRSEQRLRGFSEVMTPNMFRSELFKTSAHYWTYPERYSLDIEKEEWMLKPMNCPGHCAIFRHRVRSYKELPIRMSDFGVLHRKEASGALSGLTRVRRFVQDDGHIFCRPDQVEAELSGALDFMKYVYGVLGLQYSFVLSTRPKKAIGSREIWNNAECQLAKALNKACVHWKLNKGDGAFYGPKIDILITDISGKQIQCATIQLDFQLPLRFNLQFDDRQNAESVSKSELMGEVSEKDPERKTAEEREQEREQQLRDRGLEGPLKPGFSRPVMIHRAVFGSLERFSAILIEHFSGKWPFFLNPRQVMVVPVHPKHNEYSDYVARQMFKVGGLYVESNTDNGGNMKKKISRAIEARFSFVAVVGDDEQKNLTVTMRPRDGNEATLLIGSSPMQDAQEERRLVLPLAECIDKLRSANMPRSQDVDSFDEWQGMDPRMAAKEDHAEHC
jgi:threonyl-tRNA synthetase